MKNLLSSLVVILCLFMTAFAQNSPLRILEQPMPELPPNAGTFDIQGSVVLKALFLNNGQIGKIHLIKSLGTVLEPLAIEAVKRIKFIPKTVDGKAISVTKTLQYRYRPETGWIIAPSPSPETFDEKAEAVLKKAVENLGGEKYLQVKTLVGEGKFSIIRDNTNISFQSFVDVIVYPNKERTEFKAAGVKTVQTNAGDTGWIFDGAAGTINVQTESQVKDFKRGMNVSLDNLLRGHWRGKATLTYIGRREATLGKRNDVVKLTYTEDEFSVEYEFSAEGLPVKAIYKRTNPDGEESKEEDRYAQFVDVGGIKVPFIIDHFSNGAQTSRINYTSVEFNKTIPDSIFTKPNSPKELKKDLKF